MGFLPIHMCDNVYPRLPKINLVLKIAFFQWYHLCVYCLILYQTNDGSMSMSPTCLFAGRCAGNLLRVSRDEVHIL